MNLTKEQQLMQKVISKAWNDPTFKQELMDRPEEAIERLTGESISLPEGKRLEVYDQSNADVVYFNIPPEPDFEDVELTDEQLEVVAGGVIPINIIEGCFPPTFPPIFPGGGGGKLPDMRF